MNVPSVRGWRGAWRSRWAAIGAAVAVTFGAGGLFVVNAVSSAPSSFVSIDPVRILDSRGGNDVGLAGPFVSPLGLDLTVTGPIPTTTGTKVVVPTGATAVSLNVTVVSPTANGFVSVRPADATGLPSVSSLNFEAGDIVPNAVTVQLPTSGPDEGRIEITYNAYGTAGPTTDVLIDVNGFFEHHNLDDRSGVEFVKGDALVPLAVADVVVRTIELNTPAPGYAIVTASGYFNFAAVGEEVARCSITAGAQVINFAQLIIVTAPVDAPAPALFPDTFQSFSSTVVHPVGAGATTFHLVCEEDNGDDVSVGDASLTAQYVPSRM